MDTSWYKIWEKKSPNDLDQIQIWLDMYKHKGQGWIFLKCGTNFVPFGTKISNKNNLKQKSYKDFSFLKICKCVNPHKT